MPKTRQTLPPIIFPSRSYDAYYIATAAPGANCRPPRQEKKRLTFPDKLLTLAREFQTEPAAIEGAAAVRRGSRVVILS